MAYIKEINYFNCFVLKHTGDDDNYHVEESRIKGGFNEPFIDYGVRAHIVDRNYGQEVRGNALIHSGILNSKTGVNEINQFSIGEEITRALESRHGSIQKLFADFGDSSDDLFIFQEEKVSGAMIDKDAIFTAEGGRLSTLGQVVIGQIQTYAGNYGIGKNPESFATYAGRKYFVDKPKGIVLRLSRDGMTEISNYGMRSYLRDKITSATRVYSMWDMHNQDLVLSIQGPSENTTLVFDEGVNGWTSRYSYVPQGGGSLDGKFYTFSTYKDSVANSSDIYEHYSNNAYNTFYGESFTSEVELIFNQNVSVNKNFFTINYEGSKTWNIYNITSEQDTGVTDSALNIASYNPNNQDLIISAFKLQDGKFYSNIINSSPEKSNEVIFGGDVTGIKGYFAKMKIRTSDTGYQELFSVATNYNINTY